MTPFPSVASWGPFAATERLAPGRHHALSGDPPRCSSVNGLVPEQSGAHRVELHVPRRGQEVVFIHDERGEAVLPQVPSPALPEVDSSRVPPMCRADGATQALGGLRDNDHVNMIGYQAICPHRDLLCAAELRHELDVVLVVFLTEERLLSGVSPLGDMVRHARSYHTCQSSHGGKLLYRQLI